jgi:sulfur-oxidizing protein SoxB
MCNHSDSSKINNSNSRREFLKNTSMASLAFAGLPQIAGAITGDANGEASLLKSATVQNVKAQIITLLHTADIHGQLYTHDEFFWENGKPVYKKRGGFSVLKTMLRSLKAKNPANTLIIDGGDCFQGSGVAALSKGQAIIPLINNIGYDLVLPGNWEVVYGKEMMQKDLAGYTAQKICANMFHDTKDSKNGSLLYRPYWIKNFGPLKIGFIGYNDPLTPKRQSPAYSYGITFTHPQTNVTKYIKQLREVERCQMIFLVTHMGLAQQVDLANMSAVEGVDYILGEDTHERVRKPIEGKYSKVTEPGAFGSFVAKLDIVVENGKVKDHNYQLLDVDPEKYKADLTMNALVEKVRAPYRKELNKVIGQTKVPLVRYYVLENPMDNMIADAIMWKYKPDIALSNGFRFCPPLVPDKESGMANITNDFLWSMLPVDSDAKRGEVTGQQLLDWLEKEMNNVFAKDPAQRFGGWVIRFSGMEINITTNNDMGKRVNSVKIKGEPLDKTKTYSIIACEREGDPDTTLCRVEKVGKPLKTGDTLHQIIREYLSAHSPIAPVVENRVTATDAPKDLLSQMEGYDYEFS